MNENILIADDEQNIRDSLSFVLEAEGFRCTTVADGKAAIEELQKSNYDVLISDIKMPQINGMEVLENSLKFSPQTIVLIITAYASVETAVQTLRKGAADYLLKPLEFEDVIIRIKHLLKNKRLEKESRFLRKQIDQRFNFGNLIGQSAAIKEVFSLITRISASSTNVLITGGTGTGKELVARAIHKNSDRSNNPFVPVNCGAIPENLYESEFFGFKRGSFTGANADHDGLFKFANTGTLFLDEIGDLSEHMQVKLLRALQEKEIKPLGSNKTFKINVRIIAATNKNLLDEVQKGNFRDDLYYRINVVEIKLPNLSKRKEDIPLLVQFFIDRYNKELNRNVKGVDNEVMKAFMNYEWKGNLRELENMIERAVLLCDCEIIELGQLPPYIQPDKNHSYEPILNLNDALQNYERLHISNILEETGWNRKKTAELLGIDTSTLYRKMLKLNITE